MGDILGGAHRKTISAPTENERTVTGMAEYIEREALMRRIKEIHCAECNSYHGVRCRACWVGDTLDYIDCEPAANVAPVRLGRWIEPQRLYYGAKQYECSLCWAEAFWDKHGITEKYPCCPNCGAKMDLED